MFALMQSNRLESLHLSVDPMTGLKAVLLFITVASGQRWAAVVTLPILTTNPLSRTRCAWPRV